MTYFKYILFSSVLFSNIAFASTHFSPEVLCPQISSVQQAATQLDSVQIYNGFTYAWTSAPAFSENGLHWGIITLVKKIKDPDAALKAAVAQVQQVTSIDDPIAEKLTVYVCYYGPADVVAVSADNLSFRSEFLSFFRP